ncbi:hypothetical protein FRB96_007287 [Tulasnella sp. 330]|nr:hypothetical protein FRB96_007287 [Tulasnella sp. 330]
MTDEAILEGLHQARKYGMATACVKPYSIPVAIRELEGTTVLVCPVIGFPHGNSTTKVKVFEAIEAVDAGGREIDMVINVGKALGGDWDYVEDEIRQINEAVTKRDAILKVIFENDYLSDKHIIKLCEICSRIKPAFIKTSTGYGFVKQADGSYNYTGATMAQLQLMREHVDPAVQIKAAGGIRSLDDLLRVRAIGVTRVGATAGPTMILEAIQRGIGETPKEVQVEITGKLGGGY